MNCQQVCNAKAGRMASRETLLTRQLRSMTKRRRQNYLFELLSYIPLLSKSWMNPGLRTIPLMA